MHPKENRFSEFILLTGIITIAFQVCFLYFFRNLPISYNLVTGAGIFIILIALLLLKYSKNTFAASFLLITSLYSEHTFFYLTLNNEGTLNLGSALMVGTICVMANVLLGIRYGIILTLTGFCVILADIYWIENTSFIQNKIPSLKLYKLLSVAEPGLIIHYLSFCFYHTLALEKKDKDELKLRLETVLDNALQTIVLIDRNKRIIYADVKSRELAKTFLGRELKDGEESSQFILPDYRKDFVDNLEKAFKGEKVTLEKRIELQNQQSVWFMVMYSPLYDKNGTVDSVQFSLIDISRQKYIQEELQNAEERWKYALTSSMDGVWDWSVKDGKAYFSKMYKEMLGYKEDEIQDSFAEWEKLIHPEDKQKAFEEVLKHVKNQTEHYILEHRLLQKNGEYKWILARGKIIERDENGNPVRFIGTHTDIDHIKKVESDLKAAQEKAEQAAEAKSQFLSTMSHEIRTPLNAVIGFSNLLLKENKEVHNLEYLNNIQTSANHLLSLVNNVLDISKIESGKIEFEKREFNLENLLNENIAMLSLRAREKNIGLTLNYTHIDCLVTGDPFRLTQILNNLIGNAVKFTDQGTVELRNEILSEIENEIEIRFVVTDTGPGISTDRQKAIFESFTQASTETARKYGGTGLGLSISKHLIELQGGTIGVESSLGKGAKFFFNLRFKKGRQIVAGSEYQQQEKEDSLSGLRILVAEDNLFNTKVLTRFLDLWEASYEIAENGEKVLELISQKDFDLILMDLHMPQMDGYQATRILREAGNSIIIIALTASANFSSNDAARSSGFDSYFYKPINTKELFSKLKSIRQNKISQTAL